MSYVNLKMKPLTHTRELSHSQSFRPHFHDILKKQKKHYKTWQTLNKKFSDGFLFLRPTNKTVADLLGICERQISYYINCAKQDYKKGKNKIEIDA